MFSIEADGGKHVPATFWPLLADIAIVGPMFVQKDEILECLRWSHWQLSVPVSERSIEFLICGLFYRAFRLIGFVGLISLIVFSFLAFGSQRGTRDWTSILFLVTCSQNSFVMGLSRWTHFHIHTHG